MTIIVKKLFSLATFVVLSIYTARGIHTGFEHLDDAYCAMFWLPLAIRAGLTGDIDVIPFATETEQAKPR